MRTEMDQCLLVQDILDIIRYLEEYKNIVAYNDYDIARIDELITLLGKRKLQ